MNNRAATIANFIKIDKTLVVNADNITYVKLFSGVSVCAFTNGSQINGDADEAPDELGFRLNRAWSGDARVFTNNGAAYIVRCSAITALNFGHTGDGQPITTIFVDGGYDGFASFIVDGDEDQMLRTLNDDYNGGVEQ